MEPKEKKNRTVESRPAFVFSGRPEKNTPPVEGANPSRLNKADLKKRFRLDEFLAEKIITGVALISLAAVVMIFVFVFREAVPVFFSKEATADTAAVVQTQEEESYGQEFLGAETQDSTAKQEKVATSGSGGEGGATFAGLTSTTWQPVSENPKYGLLPLIVGSLKVTLIALLIAAPLGILAALFTSSFAPRWAREYLKPAIELLAGFPSVVIGFFALVTLASAMQNAFGFQYRLNALLGGIALSLAVIPIIYTLAEDSLTAVPKFMTEASLALGATKWQTALFVTLPAATPGVFAAILLGFGRAFGETMIVLMATGNAALLSWEIVEPVRTMSATIGAEMAEVVFGDTHYHVLFFIGAILFVFTFALNAVAEIFIRQRLLKRFKGI